MDKVQGDTPGEQSPSQTFLDWQENSVTEDTGRPSCSTYAAESVAGTSSFSQTRTNPASGLCPAPRMPQCDKDQTGPATTHDVIVICSGPRVPENNCGAVLPSGQGGGNEADKVARSQYQPLLCIQMNEPPSEVMFESNHSSTFHNPPIAMGTVGPQHQQNQHSWSGVGQMESAHFSNQNQLYPASSSQKQDSESVQPQQQQQICLPYACTFCSRRYAHQCQLRIHERIHTGEKPYQCTQCGKSFGQFCSLKRHQMVHTGERPFPCPHCGKQFSTSTNLKVHQSVHTGEKRFHCSKCGKNFSFLSNLIRHQALHATR
uniref:C2H2-type domain-containing protein n=2 Tax=Anabas testudineus TaxID=64144 RepID=A0AAQ6IEN3_ANATE